MPEWHFDEHVQIDVGRSPYRGPEDGESPSSPTASTCGGQKDRLAELPENYRVIYDRMLDRRLAKS